MPPRAKPPAPTSRQIISRQLREILRDWGMTAYALGQRANIDPGILQRFLNEERGIQLDTLDRLADVLGLRLVEGARGRNRPAAAKPTRRADPDQLTTDPPADHQVEDVAPGEGPGSDSPTPGLDPTSEILATEGEAGELAEEHDAGPEGELHWWEP